MTGLKMLPHVLSYSHLQLCREASPGTSTAAWASPSRVESSDSGMACLRTSWLSGSSAPASCLRVSAWEPGHMTTAPVSSLLGVSATQAVTTRSLGSSPE